MSHTDARYRFEEISPSGAFGDTLLCRALALAWVFFALLSKTRAFLITVEQQSYNLYKAVQCNGANTVINPASWTDSQEWHRTGTGPVLLDKSS